jgi:general secretion pathway protein I
MSRRRTDRAGFTLVEVLASLVLVAVIVPAAMAGVTLAMGLDETARQRTEAATLASGKLAEMAAMRQWQTAETSGDFGEEWPGYRWELGARDWEDPLVSEVALTVRWNARGWERELTLATLTYTGSE